MSRRYTQDTQAESYELQADLTKYKPRYIELLMKAANLYIDGEKEDKDFEKGIECLIKIEKSLKGVKDQIGADQYAVYLISMAKLYEALVEEEKAAELYLDAAKVYWKFGKEKQKALLAALGKSLKIYEEQKNYDKIFEIEKDFEKKFPRIEKNDLVFREVVFCYNRIIAAANEEDNPKLATYYTHKKEKLLGLK